MIEWKRSLAIVIASAGFAAACGSSTPTAVTTVSSLSVTGSSDITIYRGVSPALAVQIADRMASHEVE